MTVKPIQAVLGSQSEAKKARKKRLEAIRPTIAEAPVAAAINIREARRTLPQIINAVETGSSRGVLIGRRGSPAAFVVAADWIEPFLTPGNKKRKLAALIVEELLGDAPLHLKAPAVDELSRLPTSDLNKLWRMDRLPLTKGGLASLRAKLAHPEALERLVRCAKVANAIKEARKAGLYGMAEDATSALAGGADGDAG